MFYIKIYIVVEELILLNPRLIKLGRFIVKPALNTGRGRGVRLFNYKDGIWVSDDNYELSLSFLESEYKSKVQNIVENDEKVKDYSRAIERLNNLLSNSKKPLNIYISVCKRRGDAFSKWLFKNR